MSDSTYVSRDPAIKGRMGTGTAGLLLLISVLFLAAQRGLGMSSQQWVDLFGLEPLQTWRMVEIYKLFSYSMVHLDTFHWLQNSLGLVLFGYVFEKRTSTKSLLFLVFAGVAFAGMTHVAMYPTSTLPLMGFSGAIAALIGAVLTGSVPLAWLQRAMVILAGLTIAALALAAAIGGLPLPSAGDPAHVAHLAGLALGIASYRQR